VKNKKLYLNKLKITLTFLLSIFLLLFQLKTVYADTADQQCTSGSYDFHLNIANNNIEQTFTPSKDKLTKVDIIVSGDGEGSVGIRIKHGTDTIYLSGVQSEPNGTSTVSFSFDAIDVTPGDAQYIIDPYVNRSNTLLSWYYKNNCYAGGKARLSNTSMPYDMAFVTYGPDEAGIESTPTPTPTPTPTSEPTPTGDATPTPSPTMGASPTIQATPGPLDTTEPSSNIAAPTNLIAQSLMPASEKISLNWSASLTQEIHGYIAYRSETENGDYFEIGNTGPEELSFIDANVDKNKPYYYYVRTYKDYDKSEKSNIAKSSISEEVVTGVPVPESATPKRLPKGMNLIQLIFVIVGALAFAILLSFVIIKLLRKRKVKAKKPEKKDEKKPPELEKQKAKVTAKIEPEKKDITPAQDEQEDKTPK
jgi:hypothetical protein